MKAACSPAEFQSPASRPPCFWHAGAVLSVQELRSLSASLSLGSFRRQVGPFVLIQRELGPGSSDPLLSSTHVARTGDIEQGMLAMLFQFEDLLVTTLPPLLREEELSVGRLPDCDVVVDDPSVSKRHAVFRWDEAAQRCTVRDLESTNGTLVNTYLLRNPGQEVVLKDGDILSFGNVQFWYLHAATLHARLRGSHSRMMRSHSG